MQEFVILALVLGAMAYSFRPKPDPDAPKPYSFAQVNQVLLFVVLAGVILFALGIVRCEAVITT